MLTVHKLILPIDDTTSPSLPKDATVLSFQLQDDNPTIWYLCDPNAERKIRHFRLVGTGHPIEFSEERLSYIGTAMSYNHRLVLHLFEVTEENET